MHVDLSGKTAIVTGSTAGIGFEIARGLAATGATVVINGRSEENVANAVARIGGNTRGVAADLGSPEGHERLVQAEPRADIVVSNLGVFEVQDFFEADDEIWHHHWQTNVMAGVRLARSYLPAMQEAAWGRFIVISSESAFSIPSDMIYYGVSKAADVALARGLAKRMAGTGVTVNSILAGPTLTEGAMKLLEGLRNGDSRPIDQYSADFLRTHRPQSLIGRFATVDEIANMAVYLASPLSSATTGSALRADGGLIDSL